MEEDVNNQTSTRFVYNTNDDSPEDYEEEDQNYFHLAPSPHLIEQYRKSTEDAAAHHHHIISQTEEGGTTECQRVGDEENVELENYHVQQEEDDEDDEDDEVCDSEDEDQSN